MLQFKIIIIFILLFFYTNIFPLAENKFAAPNIGYRPPWLLINPYRPAEKDTLVYFFPLFVPHVVTSSALVYLLSSARRSTTASWRVWLPAWSTANPTRRREGPRCMPTSLASSWIRWCVQTWCNFAPTPRQKFGTARCQSNKSLVGLAVSPAVCWGRDQGWRDAQSS